MVTFESLWEGFKPIVLFLSSAWDWFNKGVWEAYVEIQDFLTFGGVNVFGVFYQWIMNIIEDLTQLDEWLNQYTLLSFSLGAGILIVIVITIIGWVGDKVGL